MLAHTPAVVDHTRPVWNPCITAVYVCVRILLCCTHRPTHHHPALTCVQARGIRSASEQHLRAHIHTHVHTHTYTHMCTHTHTHTHVYTRTHTLTCTHMHAHTHARTRAHTHSLTSLQTRRRQYPRQRF